MKRARVDYEKRLVGELLAEDGIHYKTSLVLFEHD